MAAEHLLTAEDEVVTFCSDLIRIESANYGGGDGAESKRAEYVAARLDEAGIAGRIVAPGGNTPRTCVLARLPGIDPGAGALLLHGHLDVAPADASTWRMPPLSGEVSDGFV
jgi:acetylornithine deacetylase/succinyl-diaminopimelate desuccinylase-like protein